MMNVSVIHPVLPWYGIFFVSSKKPAPGVAYSMLSATENTENHYIDVVSRPLLCWTLAYGGAPEALYYWSKRSRPATALEICAYLGDAEDIQHHLGDLEHGDVHLGAQRLAVSEKLEALIKLHQQEAAVYLSKDARDVLTLLED